MEDILILLLSENYPWVDDTIYAFAFSTKNKGDERCRR